MFKYLIDIYNKHRRIKRIRRIHSTKLKQQKEYKLIDTKTFTFELTITDEGRYVRTEYYFALVQRWQNSLGEKKLRIVENTYPKDQQDKLKYQMSELIKWEKSCI